MKSFLGIDGPFYNVGTMVFDIILLNLLWIVFSIPIFTMGASTTAMYYVTGKMARKEGYYVIADFWKSLKENFKQVTIIGVISQLLIGLIIFDIRIVYGAVGKINWIIIAQASIFICLLLINIYIYPLLSRFHMTTKNAITTSFFLAGKYLYITLMAIVLMAISAFIIYLVPILIAVVISIYAYITSLMFQNIFKKYVQENQDNKDEEKNTDEVI